MSWWHWCTCLAMEHGEFCCSCDSHVGAFHGRVGAEASFSTVSRAADMMAVFRITDFR
ncbi:hypothetical protein ACWDRB_45705 [Nonomuraea sp. NPDC003707]